MALSERKDLYTRSEEVIKANTKPQPRERPVPCRRCYRRRTWNVNAICNRCSDEN